jgi:hypothetical protein
MDIHKNARLTAHGRERLAKMILAGQTPQAVSEAAGVCLTGEGRACVKKDFSQALLRDLCGTSFDACDSRVRQIPWFFSLCVTAERP